MTAQDAFVGAAVERIEDLRLLRGEGRYVDDLHASGMLHAAIVRSSVAHGRIRGDRHGRGAQRCPAFTPYTPARDIANDSNGAVPTIPLRLAPLPELAPFEQCVIALDKVRWVGEPLAIVVADDAGCKPRTPRTASRSISSRCRRWPNWQAAARGESLLFEAHGSNVAITYTARKGDARKDFGPDVYVRKRNLPRPPPHRHHDGNARAARGVGREPQAS